MIDLRAARETLAAIMRDEFGDEAHVYPYAPNGLAAFPAVVVSMPQWSADEAGGGFGPCMDTSTFAVALVVERPGTADFVTLDRLEALWPRVADALRDAVDKDPTLGGVTRAAHVTRADFGGYASQGQEMPSYAIQIDLFG